MSISTQVQQVRALSQDERIDARENAKATIVRLSGNRPLREQFDNHTVSKYPTAINRLITCLCIVVLVAAFLPSSFRLYIAGSSAFGHGVPVEFLMAISGIATVLMAETSQVVASLALAIYGTNRWATRVLYTIMVMATCLALVGNVHIASPFDIFSWLEAVFPPLVVLGMSYILKNQMLHAVEQRHTNQLAYENVLAEWQMATFNPEQHMRWLPIYVNSLRDALKQANKGRRSIDLNTFTNSDWSFLVRRELQADEWFEHDEPELAATSNSPIPAASANLKVVTVTRETDLILDAEAVYPAHEVAEVVPLVSKSGVGKNGRKSDN